MIRGENYLFPSMYKLVNLSNGFYLQIWKPVDDQKDYIYKLPKS